MIWAIIGGVGVFLAILVSTTLITGAIQKPKTVSKYKNKFIFSFHRGCNVKASENTLEAFTYAHSKKEEIEKLGGIALIETDIRFTKDGYIVCLHDEELERMVEGVSGEVHKHDLDSLRRMNFSEGGKHHGTLITLEEAFQKFPDMHFSIDVKPHGNQGMDLAYDLLNLVKKYEMESKVVLATFHRGVEEFFIENADYRTTISSSKKTVAAFGILNLFGLTTFFSSPTNQIDIPKKVGSFKLLSKRLIKNAHKKGKSVTYWVDRRDPLSEKDIENAIKWGANGVCVDDMEKLIKVYKRVKGL